MSSGNARRVDDFLRAGGTDLAELKLTLTRLLSELQERESSGSPNSENLFQEALRSLAKLKGSVFAELRLRCLDRCVHYFYTSGYIEAGILAASHKLALSKAFGDREWVRKSELSLGAMYADAGNIAESFIHYAISFQIAKEAGNRLGVVRAILNLGVALTYAGLHREAIPYFRTVQSAGKQVEGAEACVDAARTDLAQAYLNLEDFRAGLQEISRPDIQGSDPTSSARALSLTIREVTFVQLALELKDYRLAEERSLECTRFSRWSGSVRSTLLAQFVDGLCNVHFGDVRQGLRALEKCSESALEVPATYWLVQSGLVKAYELAHDPSRALFHLRALQKHFREVRSQSAITLMTNFSPLTDGLEASSWERDGEVLQHREFRLRALTAESQIDESRLEMLDRLATTADLREDASGEHGFRVGQLSAALALDLGWSSEQSSFLNIAARLHDIGKIAVPDRILLATQELREAERHLMGAHTLIGSELLAKSDIPQLRMAEEIARCHHEWWNGTGYPAKLSGKRIPIHARIVALADVFDAMTHGRPYSEPWDIDRALAEIQKLRGEQFDPELTDCFIALVQRLRAEHTDLDEFLGRAGRNSPFLKARHKIREMLAAEQVRESASEGSLTPH